jgi:hypothetical protein
MFVTALGFMIWLNVSIFLHAKSFGAENKIPAPYNAEVKKECNFILLRRSWHVQTTKKLTSLINTA